MSGPARDMTPDEMRAEIWRLSQWIHDLQAGMFINCVYCGHRYGPRDSTAPVMTFATETQADALARHIATCDRHPMAKLAKENVALRDTHHDLMTAVGLLERFSAYTGGSDEDADAVVAFLKDLNERHPS